MAEDLEPCGAAAVPGGGGRAARHLCHVELQRAWVGDAGSDGEADGGTRGHAHGLRDGVRGVLVAADVHRSDVGHWAIAVVVRGHADVLPVRGGLPIRDELGEGVCTC